MGMEGDYRWDERENGMNEFEENAIEDMMESYKSRRKWLEEIEDKEKEDV